MLRLVFMGSDAIARPALDWLASQRTRGLVEIAGVFTQPDRAFGRGQQVQPNAIKRWALLHGLPVYQPEIMETAALAQLAALQPDVALVLAYGHLLRPEFIDAPRFGTLNLHTSLLPKYRGASPIQTATACGERETGVTLMRMVLRLDAGPIGDFERVAIAPLDTAAEVEAKLALACVPLLARALPRLADGSLVFTPQDESEVTFCRRLAKSDGELDFAAPAAELAARINGLFPWPACQSEIAGQAIKFGLAEPVPESGEAASLLARKPTCPGTVLGADADGLLVTTGAGLLRLRKLQRPGGKLLPAAEFLRGFPIPAGTVLVSRPMAALTGPRPFPRAKI